MNDVSKLWKLSEEIKDIDSRQTSQQQLEELKEKVGESIREIDRRLDEKEKNTSLPPVI